MGFIFWGFYPSFMDNQQNHKLNIKQPAPAGQNKFWPINWRYNRIIKIFGVICVVILIIDLVMLVGGTLYEGQLGQFASPESKMVLFIPATILVLTFPIAVILSVFSLVFSLLKFKALDRADKLFFICSTLIILIAIISIVDLVLDIAI